VPLAIAVGASANSRHSIGTGVIGGMLGATVIAVFFIPMFYYLLESMSSRSRGGKPTPGPGPTQPMVPPASAGGSGINVKPSGRRNDA
jgi:multidrug efflux pump